jgi:hypothetical protein
MQKDMEPKTTREYFILIRDILLRNAQPTPDELLLLMVVHATRMFRPLSDIREERKTMRRKLK